MSERRSGLFRRLSVLPAMAALLWLAIGARAAAASEIEARAALKSQAAQLLERGDITAYDQRASELRHTRERTPAGIWQLSLFYNGVDDLPWKAPGAPVWARIEQDTDAYLQGHPDSASAVIAAAGVLVAHAWAHRGNGPGAQLDAEQRKGFGDHLDRARAILDAHRDARDSDPDWYALRILVMNGQGDDRSAILALAKEALGGEPTYQTTYYVASTALLPKWGGSAQLLQQYLSAVIARTSAQEGRQAYARIAFNIARNDPRPIQSLRELGISWPLVKSSLEEISAAYPDEWNLNAERAMACLIGTEPDYRASASRAGARLISVAWFDSQTNWPDCERRQRAAAPASFDSAVQDVLSAAPSPYLLSIVCAAILLAMVLLYLARRPGQETTSPEWNDDPSAAVYRATPAWRLGQVALGIVFVVAGAAGVWAFGAVVDALRGTSAGLGLAFFSALLAASGVLIAVDACVSKLLLQTNALQIVQLWRTRQVRREDIASRRIIRRPNSPALLVLRFKDPAHRPVKLPLVFPLDTRFDGWFQPIPDLDAQAAAALETEIRSDPELGSTPEERVARFAQARKIARNATFVAPVLYVWSSIYPQPYLLIIGLLALLPWLPVALMANSPGVYQLTGSAASGRPDLTAALIAPALLFALRAFSDVHILDWSALMPWVIGGAGLLAASTVWVNRKASPRWGAAIVILLAAGAYGFGAAASADAVLDASAPITYKPAVLRKHVSGGRNRSYELTVDPWGPRKSADDITVPLAVFNQARVGQSICVSVHAGALASAWYRASACEAAGAY
jgi:hypothetical protein